MSNDEKRDIEDRINDAMAKSSVILQESLSLKIKITDQLLTSRQDLRNQQRPRKITYVPIDESEFEPIVIPEKKSIRH